MDMDTVEKKDGEVNEPANDKVGAEDEILDPGQMEGVKKDPRAEQDNIGPDHPRFKEVYGKWKASSEKVAELEKKVAELSNKTDDEALEEMRQHNVMLMKKLEELDTKVVESKPIVKDSDALRSHLDDLKAKRKQARADMDHDLADELSDQILDVDRAYNKALEVEAKAPVKKPDTKSSEAPVISKELEVAFNAFKEDCKEWFAVDKTGKGPGNDATAFAMHLDTTLMNHPKWKDKPITERFAEVKRQTEAEFGFKSKKSAPAVEGDSGDKGGSSNDNFGLSEAELKMAKNFRMSPEAYLKQKLAIQKENASG